MNNFFAIVFIFYQKAIIWFNKHVVLTCSSFLHFVHSKSSLIHDFSGWPSQCERMKLSKHLYVRDDGREQGNFKLFIPSWKLHILNCSNIGQVLKGISASVGNLHRSYDMTAKPSETLCHYFIYYPFINPVDYILFTNVSNGNTLENAQKHWKWLFGTTLTTMSATNILTRIQLSYNTVSFLTSTAVNKNFIYFVQWLTITWFFFFNSLIERG